MRKLLICIGIAGALVLSGSSANATLYVDHDAVDAIYGSGSGFYSSIFDIVNGDLGDSLDIPGYNPLAEEVVSAVAEFTFYNASKAKETLAFQLGGQNLPVQSSYFTMFSMFSGDVTGSALVDLSADGIVTYTVSWVSTDGFKFDSAALTAEAVPKSVPDGGSMLSLLGLAMAGLGCMRRRFNT